MVCIYIYAHTYTYTLEYYSAIKKNRIMSYASTWLDLKIIILNEISQTEKDKYNMAYFTYMWNLKYDRNKHIYETGTDSQA